MASNNALPKLLPARLRVSAALQQAQSTPFTPEQLAMIKSAQPAMPSKKKSGAAAALLALLGQF